MTEVHAEIGYLDMSIGFTYSSLFRSVPKWDELVQAHFRGCCQGTFGRYRGSPDMTEVHAEIGYLDMSIGFTYRSQ